MSDTHIHIHLEGGEPVQAAVGGRKRAKAATKSAPAKRRRKKDLAMSRALKAANKKARKKDGSFKKGWGRGRVMSEAHRLKKKG